MEKELNILKDNFSIDYIYSDLGITIKNIDFKGELQNVASVFSSFLHKKFNLGQKTVLLNLSLVSDERIIEINKEYREKAKVTDVLSFPLQESIRNNEMDIFNNHLELGDIIICHSVCEKQAVEFSLTYIEEFLHLLTHGFLHICGYDHETSPVEEKVMEELEVELLLKIKDLRS